MPISGAKMPIGKTGPGMSIWMTAALTDRIGAHRDNSAAAAAAEACRGHRLAITDAIIFATARARSATLLTCDTHFEGLPGVTLIEKIKP